MEVKLTMREIVATKEISQLLKIASLFFVESVASIHELIIFKGNKYKCLQYIILIVA